MMRKMLLSQTVIYMKTLLCGVTDFMFKVTHISHFVYATYVDGFHR